MAPFSPFESVDYPRNCQSSDARTEHGNRAFSEPRRVCGRVKYDGPPGVHRVVPHAGDSGPGQRLQNKRTGKEGYILHGCQNDRSFLVVVCTYLVCPPARGQVIRKPGSCQRNEPPARRTGEATYANVVACPAYEAPARSATHRRS